MGAFVLVFKKGQCTSINMSTSVLRVNLPDLGTNVYLQSLVKENIHVSTERQTHEQNDNTLALVETYCIDDCYIRQYFLNWHHIEMQYDREQGIATK